MSKVLSKKYVLFFGLIVALAAAVYVNWYYTKPMSQIQGGPETETTEHENLGEAQYVQAQNSDYFAAAALARSTAHAQAQSVLQETLSDDQVDAESKKAAQTALEALAAQIKAEADIETLVMAKSGKKCLVTLGDTAEVVLEKGALNEQLALQIKEIIVHKTDVSAEKITLVEQK